MNLWRLDDATLTRPYTFEDSEVNIILVGKLRSSRDIAFKVKNMVVFGEIHANNIRIETEENFFRIGTMEADCIRIISGSGVYNTGISQVVKEKIEKLGVDLMNEDGKWFVEIPEDCKFINYS